MRGWSKNTILGALAKGETYVVDTGDEEVHYRLVRVGGRDKHGLYEEQLDDSPAQGGRIYLDEDGYEQ
jgi:hypothetical protein